MAAGDGGTSWSFFSSSERDVDSDTDGMSTSSGDESRQNRDGGDCDVLLCDIADEALPHTFRGEKGT